MSDSYVFQEYLRGPMPSCLPCPQHGYDGSFTNSPTVVRCALIATKVGIKSDPGGVVIVSKLSDRGNPWEKPY